MDFQNLPKIKKLYFTVKLEVDPRRRVNLLLQWDMKMFSIMKAHGVNGHHLNAFLYLI